MTNLLRSAVLLGCFFLINQSTKAQDNREQTTVIDQKKIAYKTYGLSARKAGEPVIVFEQGMGGGAWEQLYAFLPAAAARFEYSRNGIGSSEPDTSLQTHTAVVNRLHILLQELKIAPPYLLVGHSVGGAYIRLFAARFPGETAGLVFIDPTDFMLTAAEDIRAKMENKSKTSYREIWLINLKEMSGNSDIPLGPRREMQREYRLAQKGFFTEYRELGKLPDIPVTVLISYQKPEEQYEAEMNARLKLGINREAWWRAYDQLRISHYSDLIRNNHASALILLPRYSHGIHFQDPELSGAAISRVYQAILKPAQ